MCLCKLMPLCVSVCIPYTYRYLGMQEEGIGTPGAGVVGSYKLPSVGAGELN